MEQYKEYLLCFHHRFHKSVKHVPSHILSTISNTETLIIDLIIINSQKQFVYFCGLMAPELRISISIGKIYMVKHLYTNIILLIEEIHLPCMLIIIRRILLTKAKSSYLLTNFQ